nr:MAG TPA: hypothetical protein [Caudoviricetes sp.]
MLLLCTFPLLLHDRQEANQQCAQLKLVACWRMGLLLQAPALNHMPLIPQFSFLQIHSWT